METLTLSKLDPVLPVMTYETLDDAIDFVNQRDHPLGLYVFGKDRANIEKVIQDSFLLNLNTFRLHNLKLLNKHKFAGAFTCIGSGE